MKIEQVGLQIFTIREHLETDADIADAMKKLRDIGYRAVETYSFGEIDNSRIKQILDDSGLACCGIHYSADTVTNDTDKVIEDLNILETQCAVISSSIEHIESPDTKLIAELTAKFNTSGRRIKDAGKTLVYHNHSDEFKRIDGKLVLDMILENTDPENLKMQIDTHWVQHGGGDSAKWCKKLNGRLASLHLKDYGITGHREKTFDEIGYGNLDFKDIVTAGDNNGAQWYIVEQDICRGDSLESVKKSFDYIKQNLVT